MIDLKIRPLRTEADWQNCRLRLETFEKGAITNPWANWAYMHASWQTFEDNHNAWLVDFIDRGEPAGYAIWHVQKDRRRFAPQSLRAFDWVFFMRTYPYVCVQGMEYAVAEAIVENTRLLRRTTGADLMAWYRMDIRGVRPMSPYLKIARKYWQRTVFTPAPQIVPGPDLEGYLESKHKSEMADLVAQGRRLTNKFGKLPDQRHVAASDLSDEAFELEMGRMERAMGTAWQQEWAKDSGRVDLEKSREFRRECFRSWRKRGGLWFHYLVVEDRDAAHFITLEDRGRIWCLIMGYDQELKTYSLGRRMFIEMLRFWHARGAGTFELGGEVLAWKMPWATRMEGVHVLTYSMGSLKGRLWVLSQKFKQFRGEG